jgi:protein-disulfide isomerase
MKTRRSLVPFHAFPPESLPSDSRPALRSSFTLAARVGTALAVLVCVMGYTACQTAKPAPLPTEAEKTQMEQRVEEYFRRTANLPPGVTLKVVDVAPAVVPGFLTATLEASSGGQTQRVPLLISRDGRYFTHGRLIDLTADPYQAIMAKISLKDEPMRGNPNAKVTIVEYSDFECAFCGRAYTTIETQVMKEYGDKVRLVFKDFPLSNIHSWAESAALASACARRQSADGFWKLYDFFFQNQKTITPDNLKAKAEGVIKSAGLDVAAFDTCLDSKAAADLVRADQDEGEALGVRSTPTFFINGRRLQGAPPYEKFKAVLDAALAGGEA